MTQPTYAYDATGRFVVDRYNEAAPFASFLPGIAGVTGRPAWVFYVNRGQGVASFGTRNKDGAFLEFFPADKAYQLTPSRGFRTFLKITGDGAAQCYEPFQHSTDNVAGQRLSVAAHDFAVEETNPALGLRIRVDYCTLPEAPVAALLRRVEVCNTAKLPRKFDIVDGLPQVLPYALNQWMVKYMSRTSEAFMNIEGVADNLPFYRLKTWPGDTPDVQWVVAGNFFAGLLDGHLNPVVVDAEAVFGLAGDFSRPERFYGDAALDLSRQVTGNQTPAAMQAFSLELQAGECRAYYGVYGHAATQQVLADFIAAAARPGYFEAKRQENRQILDRLLQAAACKTGDARFDAHVRQCFLDNGLRGSFPQAVPGGAQLYLFGRKHGDLERDYNDFLLQDTPYSEGNGDFRDMLQNRRLGVMFDPALGAKDIRYFFNLVQPDGYNPCLLRNARYYVAAPENFAGHFQRYPGLQALLDKEFKYAELWQTLAAVDADPGPLLQAILTQAEEIADVEFDRGYWSDHWTYLLDLLLSYQALYPDKLPGLLREQAYSFFDATHYVAPRAEKYRLATSGVRQYGAVKASAEKQALMASRQRHRYQARAGHGHGDIVRTCLLGKILTLVANKLATLDPYGVGIEMEADRPGWCDALNGLPGLFGSAVNETIELKRLVDFTLAALPETGEDCRLPVELAEFIAALHALLTRPELTPWQFWQDSGAFKEAYRQQVFIGFDGAERALSLGDIQAFLQAATRHLDAAIAKAYTPDGITTYFAYAAEQYQETGDGRVTVARFRQRALPPFLEAYVHALRIATAEQAGHLYAAVRRSPLYDAKLGMYRLNAPLGDAALELGRIGVFNYGWLENGSIFLHMHYKFVLEMLRVGLVDEFYANLETLLVAFRDPNEYCRDPAECSSFLVSSGFGVDPRQHGRGCVARLSGATVELLHICTQLFLGSRPFVVADDVLCFRPQPLLAERLFTRNEQLLEFYGQSETLPADSATSAVLGTTLLVYHNPKRQPTFGTAAVKPLHYRLYGYDGSLQEVQAAELQGATAEALRQGEFRRVDVLLG